MTQPRTRLEFEATIGGVSVKAPKEDGFSHTLSGGGLELKLTLALPDAPKAPGIPWDFKAGNSASRDDSWKPRPADLPKKKGEDDEAYAARDDVVQRRRDQERYDGAVARWSEEVAEYRRRHAAHSGRLMVYAQITGIVSVLGNQRLLVVLEPLNQDLLPGFTASLLAEPEGGEE